MFTCGASACAILLLLRWRYSPGWALASFTIRLQASRSLALSLLSFIPIFLRSVDTSSSHLIFGLPLRLVAYSFPNNIFFGIAVSCILCMWPSHRILWHLMNLTTFSPLVIASNSPFACAILFVFKEVSQSLCTDHARYSHGLIPFRNFSRVVTPPFARYSPVFRYGACPFLFRGHLALILIKFAILRSRREVPW